MGKNGINILTGRIVESFNNQTGAVTVPLLTTAIFNATTPSILELRDQDGDLITSVTINTENIGDFTTLTQDNKIRVITIDPLDLTTVDEQGVLDYLNVGITIGDKEVVIVNVIGLYKYFLTGIGVGSYGGANPLIVAGNLLIFDISLAYTPANDAEVVKKDGSVAMTAPLRFTLLTDPTAPVITNIGTAGTGAVAEVASLNITAAPTADGNVTVGLNGVSVNVAVTKGATEVSSLVITGTVTTAGSVDISLNGVITSVAVALNDTNIQVADKIRAAVFTGWTTGGTAATDTVTFTSNTVGVKTDTTYSVGTSAGATGAVTTTTQGIDADTTTTVATKIRAAVFTGWTTSGTTTNVTFTATATGAKTDATYSAGTTGATGTITTTTQGKTDTIATYNYYIVAEDSLGRKTLVSPVGTTTTGNATLSATNYNKIDWVIITGAINYYVLKGTTGTLLAIATTNTLNDIGQATSIFTPPTRNATVDAINNNEAVTKGQFDANDAEVVKIEYPAYIFDGYKEYSSENSISESHFTGMSNGNILMIYRSSNAYNWHIGNDGYIAGRISGDQGKNFGNEFTIFDNEYDNRNSLTALLPDGRVIVLFRNLNFISSSESYTISMSYVTSSDNGSTWSAKTDIIDDSQGSHAPHGKVLFRGNDVVFTTYGTDLTGTRKIYLWKSTDSFATLPTSTTLITDPTGLVAEPIIVDIPNGKSILFARNGSSAIGVKSFYQYNSTDGETFTFKGMTNIYDDLDHSVQSSIYAMLDSQGRLVVVSTERNRIFSVGSDSHRNNSLRIYIQDPLDVYNSELAYKLKHEIPRPIPNNNSFYGYPNAIEVDEGLLVGICDKYFPEPNDSLNGFNESSSIYTFLLRPVANSEEVKALGVEDNKVPIKNAYGLFDKVDYDTVSGYRGIETKFVSKFNKYKLVSNLTTSNDIKYAWKDLYLKVIANTTIELTSYLHIAHTEFEGVVVGNYTLNIISDANMIINGVSGSNYSLTNGQFFKIKIINSTNALLTIGGGVNTIQIKDDATFDPATQTGTEVITYTI